MSNSDVPEAVSEATIAFGHGGEVTVKLATNYKDVEQERFEGVLEHVAPSIGSYLDFVAHMCELNEELAHSVHSEREFPLVFFDAQFTVTIAVRFGELTLPLENVYFIVHSWLYPVVSSVCGYIVQARTSVPAEHATIHTMMGALEMTQSMFAALRGDGLSMN